MHRHGGSIDVESEPGRGSTFYLYLPVYHGATAAGAETRGPTRTRSGRILFMDDEAAIRNVVCDMLERLGHACLCAANGTEAILQFDQARQTGQPFDAVILDLTVPGNMGGKEAAVQIHRCCPDVPLIVSSGYAEDPVIATPGKYGFTASLRKPFIMSELAKVLGELLA
jgi:CheY-like chemotaxis protein